MDRRIRELQRLIASGNASALQELDSVLQRMGYIVTGHTDEYGSSPGEMVYLVPVTDSLVSIATRTANGGISFLIEEVDEPGEHIGEYSQSVALVLANNYLNSVQAEWVPGDCSNPQCEAVDRTILLEMVPDASAPWEIPSDTLYLKCVECDTEWVDHTA